MGVRDQYVAQIKEAAVTMATGSAMSALVVELPEVFSNGFLYAVVEELIEQGIKWLVDKGELGMFFTFVDLRVNQQGRDFFTAVTKWASAQTPEEKAKNEADFKKAFSTLVRLTS